MLDEATSAVDPATEQRLTRALDTLTDGRTTLTIAHRLSTAERADEILVVDAGHVVQRGTHARTRRRRGSLRPAARLVAPLLGAASRPPRSAAAVTASYAARHAVVLVALPGPGATFAPPGTARRERRGSPPRRAPLAVPFAVAFGFLLTAEVLYLGWLVWEPEPAVDRFLVIPLVLAVAAAVGSVLVLQGRRGGWVVLAVAAVLAAAGPGRAGPPARRARRRRRRCGPRVLLLVGPLATLVLALRRPVREWCGAGRARRSPEGRRGAASAR